jgi:hypothetical protein
MYKTKEQRNAYQKQWYQKNKTKHIGMVARNRAQYREEFSQLKMRPCMDCGFMPQHPIQMDWDHLRGDKTNEVSIMVQRGQWAKARAEIEKCDLVCSNCHRLRTITRIAG